MPAAGVPGAAVSNISQSSYTTRKFHPLAIIITIKAKGGGGGGRQAGMVEVGRCWWESYQPIPGHDTRKYNQNLVKKSKGLQCGSSTYTYTHKTYIDRGK